MPSIGVCDRWDVHGSLLFTMDLRPAPILSSPLMSAPLLFLVGFLILGSAPPPSLSAESPTCLAVYHEGGAPAVFRSPKCPRWTLIADDLRSRPTSPGCLLALHQGRRRSQEDRAVCFLDMRIPFLGRMGVEEITVGLLAVFDGHNGDEASDMSSRLLVEYFLLHVYFILDRIYSVVLKRSTEELTYNGVQNLIFEELNLDEGQKSQYMGAGRSKWISPIVFDRSFHMLILKESLLRAIHDIDATFSVEALSKDLDSGSTATIVLIADGQVLTANIGDSKAILCSENHDPLSMKGNSRLKSRNRHRRNMASLDKCRNSRLANFSGYLVKELTKDHHPSRDDERKRVEAAGGYVVEWAGVFRVNGDLAITRAIGDMPFKSYGVISQPEVTDWYAITSNDSYLVAASDGVFEKMTTQEVCDVLWDRNIGMDKHLDFPAADSLADYIIATAFERDTLDNMAAIVVPLGSNAVRGMFLKDGCDLDGSFTPSCHKLEQVVDKKAGASLVPMEYTNQITSRFNRLLVEANSRTLGCFYLSENLNETMDFVFQAPNDHQHNVVHDLSHALPEPLVACWGEGGPPDAHYEHGSGFSVGAQNEGNKGQCTSPGVFAKLLGLLDSIPYSEIPCNLSEPFQRKVPHFRYILKRRFDRGSYGEVWLALHWNYSRDVDGSKQKNNYQDAPNDDNLFILKRIMVERGTAAYLSGLREKYFGEVFLNASLTLGSLVSVLSTAWSMESDFCFSDPLQISISCINGKDYLLNPITAFPANYSSATVHVEEGLKHIARYIESFESASKEIWLVFRYEGLSLSKLIYTAEVANSATNKKRSQEAQNIQVLHPSAWWRWLRTTEAGQKELQNIIWQLLMALKSCHDRNITHRDIKPENMIICFEDLASGRCLREVPNGGKQYRLNMRIIDFGSAIDDFTLRYLYGPGPTRSEQTYEYTPPEALLNANWFRGSKSGTLKYDMWSVGVVILELILGSPHVFQISDRTRILLDQHLEGWSEHTRELAYKLRSYMEMCILIPEISSQPHHNGKTKDHSKSGVSPASWKCSEESFAHQIKSRDPLGLGFPDVWALRLVRQLLVWHPEDRLNVDDALRHPYFQNCPERKAHERY